ncbi:hypothetical protein FDI95_gp111 [Citrobacter phage CF1 ERZ-2017]|uniref:Uncharacterized protein n=1 Tax=Citrobacter phage CF1 ERZ-2017 TaxID=2267236 RepID=A0A2H4YG57_9CAUD|nr:hypothetical protein FDI95_gp111 [Citrobacter phage CF1 ERZ-2017]AUE22984.1 hypothetical protein Cf1_00111 [Citrobacter phage CF1 ERZ-2017]WKV23454.1 hypothetical protein SEA1_gp0106 [Salmonella phage SEA1]
MKSLIVVAYLYVQYNNPLFTRNVIDFIWSQL